MGFTKLDERILQSSIMAEKAEVFKVWIALLASCRQNGIADVSSVFLSATCHLPQKTVDHAIEVLSAPDPRSRSLADEGRRIKRVDGGFFVINYDKYREFSYSDNPETKRKREYRERLKTGHFGTCPGHSASASASASDSVFLNLQGWVWEGITLEDKSGWSKAYPACDIERELFAMIEWAKANPQRAVKKNYRRFITNWLARSQDKGGGMKSNSGKGRDIYAGIREFGKDQGVFDEQK